MFPRAARLARHAGTMLELVAENSAICLVSPGINDQPW